VMRGNKVAHRRWADDEGKKVFCANIVHVFFLFFSFFSFAVVCAVASGICNDDAFMNLVEIKVNKVMGTTTTINLRS